MFHPYAQLYMIPYMVSYSPNIIVVNSNEYHVEWRVYLILGTNTVYNARRFRRFIRYYRVVTFPKSLEISR